jgi:hypothetical protein
VDQLNIGEGNGRMGMLVYSSSIDTMVEPSTDRDYLKEHAMNLRHPREGTNTAVGIKVMTEIFEVAKRPGVPQIGVVITDGLSKIPQDTSREARLAKDIGIHMYAVGVSEYTDPDELSSIASSRANVLSVKSFGILASSLQDLVQLVCPSKFFFPPRINHTVRAFSLILILYALGLFLRLSIFGFFVNNFESQKQNSIRFTPTVYHILSKFDKGIREQRATPTHPPKKPHNNNNNQSFEVFSQNLSYS